MSEQPTVDLDMPMVETISIIICTYNRAESLAETLRSINRLLAPPEWNVELLVVDNGSNDQTQFVLENFRSANFDYRHIFEPTRGLSHARNAGMKNTHGEIILFTDDDVRPPVDWIHSMCSPIAGGQCDAVAGGVKFPPHIESLFSHPTLKRLKNWFASTDELHPETPCRMVGANMAFGRHVLSKVPSFDTELGAGPGLPGFGDETLFSALLLREGFRIKAALGVAVEHHFDINRINTDALLNLARRMGESEAFISWHFRHKKHLFNSFKLLKLKFLFHSFRR